MKAAALAAGLLLSACAFTGPGTVEDTSPGIEHTGGPTLQAAQDAVHPGSTKEEVAAALGAANGYRFDSGFEVWVYRWLGTDRSARGATEFVILFGPDGRVRKTRIRPGVQG